jgi:hypothetical protein
MPSSCASVCSRSTVGPDTGSAMSKRSSLSDLQKYGALNSSCSDTIWAPRAAASRTLVMVRSRLAARSSLAVS